MLSLHKTCKYFLVLEKKQKNIIFSFMEQNDVFTFDLKNGKEKEICIKEMN